MRVFTLLLVALGVLEIAAAHGESVAESAQKSELPAAVEPQASVELIRVAPPLSVELVAAEPLVRDPVAMEFDENGAAYVIELPRYNEHGKPGQKTPCSICRLEDTDGDGTFDKRITFAELNYPTGLFCYAGGLFVGDPPHLLYLRDSDGDGRADQREEVLSGFGTAPAGESQLNSFRWTLDNRIRISTGLDGGEIRPGDQPDSPAANVRNRHILLEPRSRAFELTSGGGQNGMCLDDWGRVYVCDNSRPIMTMMYDDRYIERNPLMSAPAAMVNVGPGGNFTKLARISPPESWRQIRTRLRNVGKSVDDTYEAGRDSGQFTSATGITIYRGDAWPAELHGTALVGEVANNLIYHARVKPDGLKTIAERAEVDREFFASTDTWFRPVQFSQGPDGCLYVLDMYRQLIEGIQWVPQEVLAEMDPTAGADRGRIYRIVPNGFKQPTPIHLGEASTEQLVTLLEHPNSWHRETAARLIYERQDKTANATLRRLLAESGFPLGRMHALYALDGLASLECDDVLRGLADEHPQVREHAVRLAEKLAGSHERLCEKLVELTSDPDVGVRFQLAFSLGCVPPADRDAALLALLRGNGEDAWFRMAIQSSLGAGAARFFRLVMDDQQLRQTEQGEELLVALAKQIGRGHKGEEIAEMIAAIERLDGKADAVEELTKKLVIASLADGDGATFAQLSAGQGRVQQSLTELLASAKSNSLDDKLAVEVRAEAIKLLGCGSFESARTVFEQLLGPRQPQPIQQAALKALSRFSDVGVAKILLANWLVLTPNERASAAEVLLSRPSWAKVLLESMERNEIARGDLDPARVALLQSHPSPDVRQLAASVFSGAKAARRADVVARYQPSLERIGDSDLGRAVFEKQCAACHKLDGAGNEVGVDLRAIGDRGADAILLSILDPNREVLPRFVSYSVTTADGRTITGMILEETPNNLTLRQADGTNADITRGDIDEMRSTGMSFMPEGLELQIDQQAMANLLAYLKGRGQATGGEGADTAANK